MYSQHEKYLLEEVNIFRGPKSLILILRTCVVSLLMPSDYFDVIQCQIIE